MNEPLRALVVDDEATIRQLLRETLRRTAYTVVTAGSGEEALRLIREEAFDVAVVDLNLGGRIDGLHVLEALRWRWPATAVVILTAFGSLESAMAAIREGVDGYLLKPAKPAEIRDMVEQALERRKQLRGQTAPDAAAKLACGPFYVDLETYSATCNDRPLTLTPQEFRLLAHLIKNADRVVPHTELVRVVRGIDVRNSSEASSIIKWYVHRLRKEIEPDPSDPSHLITVRGVGYRFQA